MCKVGEAADEAAGAAQVIGEVSHVYPTLRQAVLGPLSEALSERGLVPLGTPRDRDEDATE